MEATATLAVVALSATWLALAETLRQRLSSRRRILRRLATFAGPRR